MEVDNYLLKRTHFPVVLEKGTMRGTEIWHFPRIELPPYHPSMLETGIPFKLVPDVLDAVIEETMVDLREIAQKRPSMLTTEDIAKYNGKSRILDLRDDGVGVHELPFVIGLWVDQRDINPYGPSGDQGIRIHPERAARTFMLPKEVTFTSELMNEYGIEAAMELFHARQFKCKQNWYRHNLGHMDAIFYRNLVMALDNEVVKEKYHK